MDPIDGALSLVPRPLKALCLAALMIGYVLFLALWYLFMIPVAIAGGLEMLAHRLFRSWR